MYQKLILSDAQKEYMNDLWDGDELCSNCGYETPFESFNPMETDFIPSYSVIGNGSIVDDIVKAFKRTGKNGGNIPIESVEPHYYSKSKPRESFALNARKRETFRFSDNNNILL